MTGSTPFLEIKGFLLFFLSFQKKKKKANVSFTNVFYNLYFILSENIIAFKTSKKLAVCYICQEMVLIE